MLFYMEKAKGLYQLGAKIIEIPTRRMHCLETIMS